MEEQEKAKKPDTAPGGSARRKAARPKALTEKQVLAKVRGLDADAARRTVCALVGHSVYQGVCFAYYHCERCGVQVGDTLGSIYPGAERAVVTGHDCATCEQNAKAATWKDRLLMPGKFTKKGFFRKAKEAR